MAQDLESRIAVVWKAAIWLQLEKVEAALDLLETMAGPDLDQWTREVLRGAGRLRDAIPADAEFRLDARTSFGTVTSGFKLATKEGKEKSHLIGTVGEKPGAALKLSTSNGSIRVDPMK